MKNRNLWVALIVLVIALSIAGTFFLNTQETIDNKNAEVDIPEDIGRISSNVSDLGSNDEIFSTIEETLESLQ